MLVDVIAVIFLGFGLGVTGCGVKATRQEKDALKVGPASTSGQSPTADKPSPPMTTVHFVAEATEVPGVFSSGSFINDQYAWVTDKVDLKRTTDGGRTWQKMRPSPEDEAIFGRLGDVAVTPSFITPTRGWVRAGKGLWQTDDGGESWRQLTTEYAVPPVFADAQYGWMGRYDESYLQGYVTADAGRTWLPCKSKLSLNSQTPRSLFFLTPRLGWAVTNYTDKERGKVYGVARTTDGGCSWQQLWTSDDDPDQMYCNIYFLNEKEGWLAGCYGNGNLMQTKDGGKTWHEARTPVAPWQATPIDVFFINSSEGWIITRTTEVVNPEGLYHTADGGQTWQPISDSEVTMGRHEGEGNNPIPLRWKSGRLFQMLYASKAGSGTN